MRGIRAVLFDAGGTLIHLDGERVCRPVGVGFEEERFRQSESDAVSAVRALVLERPDSTDADRIPLFFDRLLSGLGLSEAGARRTGAGAIAAEHRRANLWSRRADGALETLEA